MFGEGRIWGIFPVVGDSENTYLVRYNCAENEWETDEDSIQELGDPLQYPAITFQPAWYPSGHGRVFIAGMLDEDYPMLFWYDIGDDSFDEEDVDTFEFGAGASLAHGPAWFPLGVPLYANPGWLFCLAGGGGGQFWRYAIPYELVALDSICPAESAVIADQTPPFKWSATGELHRLVVATDPDFNNVVLDEETESPTYETETEFDKGPYYWKTGTSVGLGAWSWSAVRYFLLDFGWVSLEPLPESADAGAALAYDHKSYYPSAGLQLAAFQGNGSTKFWRYVLSPEGTGTWTQSCMPNTPCPQYSGSALATPTLNANSDRPYAMFRNATQLYWPDFQNWNEYSALPQTPGNGASLTYAHHDGADWLYYVPGGNEDAFYRLQLSDEEEGVASPKLFILWPRARDCSAKAMNWPCSTGSMRPVWSEFSFAMRPAGLPRSCIQALSRPERTASV